MSAFNYNKPNLPRRVARRGQNPIPLGVLSSISIIHIDQRAFDVRTDPFVHFHTSKEFISVDLCYNDLRREKKRTGNTTEPTDTIFIYCCVCLCFIMSRRGDRGARWGKKRQRKRVAFKWRNAGGGGMGWGRWDSRMTLLVGDLYPLVEWPSSRGKIYRIFKALS